MRLNLQLAFRACSAGLAAAFAITGAFPHASWYFVPLLPLYWASVAVGLATVVARYSPPRLSPVVFTGAAIVLLATLLGERDKLIAALMGGILIFTSARYVRPIQSFGFAFGLLSGAALIASGVYLGTGANDAILKVIGLTSCLYAVLDIKSDIIDRPGPGSDAYFLAQHTHIPTLFWGILWSVIAITGAVYFLLLASRRRGQGA